MKTLLKLNLLENKVTSPGDGIIPIASSGLKIQFWSAVGAPFDVKAGPDENGFPNPGDNERDDISADLTPESHTQSPEVSHLDGNVAPVLAAARA